MAGFPGYGIGGYGTSPYGGVGTGVQLASAFALNTRTVRVAVVGMPLRSSPFATGDGLNPATWFVENLFTGQVYSVVAATLAQDPDTFDIALLEDMGPIAQTHRIGSTALRSTHGVLVSAPTTIDFPGVAALAKSTPEHQAADRRLAVADVASVEFPRGNAAAGTLLVTAAGDYDVVQGTALVRKLILRRLSTTPGGFFHLPDYGVGLRLKQTYNVGDLIKLKAEIERQLRREPEVAQVTATPSISSAGILTVLIRATLAPSGQQLSIGFRSLPTGLLEL